MPRACDRRDNQGGRGRMRIQHDAVADQPASKPHPSPAAPIGRRARTAGPCDDKPAASATGIVTPSIVSRYSTSDGLFTKVTRAPHHPIRPGQQHRQCRRLCADHMRTFVNGQCRGLEGRIVDDQAAARRAIGSSPSAQLVVRNTARIGMTQRPQQRQADQQDQIGADIAQGRMCGFIRY